MSATVTAQTSKNEHLSFRLTFGRYTGPAYKAFADLGRPRAHSDIDLFFNFVQFFQRNGKIIGWYPLLQTLALNHKLIIKNQLCDKWSKINIGMNSQVCAQTQKQILHY